MYNDKLLVITSTNILVYKIKPVNLLTDTMHINKNMQLLLNYNTIQKDSAYQVTTRKAFNQTWNYP